VKLGSSNLVHRLTVTDTSRTRNLHSHIELHTQAGSAFDHQMCREGQCMPSDCHAKCDVDSSSRF